MRALTALLCSLVILLASAAVYGDEGANMGPPQKVTAATMSGSQDEGEAGAVSEGSAAIERDLATIREGESASAASIVIKVVALAAAVAGLGLVYLTRRRGEGGPK